MNFRKTIITITGILITLICFLPAIYFLFSGGYYLFLSLDSKNWSYSMGTIVTVIEYDDYWKYNYKFSVEGSDEVYYNSRVSFSEKNLEIEKNKSFEEGDSVKVYYPKYNPNNSVLVRGFGFMPIIYLILGLIFVPIGIIASMYFRGRIKIKTY